MNDIFLLLNDKYAKLLIGLSSHHIAKEDTTEHSQTPSALVKNTESTEETWYSTS